MKAIEVRDDPAGTAAQLGRQRLQLLDAPRHENKPLTLCGLLACSPRTTMHVDVAVAMTSGVLRGE